MLEAGPQGANVRKAPGTSAPILLKAKPGAAAPATGREQVAGGKPWYEIEAEGRKGWVSSGVVRVRPAKDDDDKARVALRAIVTQDKQTFKNGLEVLRKLVELQRKGVNVEVQKAQFAKIAKEFLARQSLLQSKVPASLMWTQQNDGMAQIQVFVNELGIKGLGFVPIPLIVSLVTASLLAYGLGSLLGLLGGEYSTSKKNLVESEALTKALASLTPQEANAVRNDLENQIDTAYGTGVKDEKKDSFFGKIKRYALVGAIGLGLFIVVPPLLQMKKAA